MLRPRGELLGRADATPFAAEGVAPPREQAAVVVGVVQRADALRLGGHEANQSRDDGADAPRRLPRLLVVGRDGEADALARLEAAVRREQDDLRRLERVLGWQQDAAVVDARREARVRRPPHRKVPLEEVGLQRERVEQTVRLRVQLLQLLEFGHYSTDGVARHFFGGGGGGGGGGVLEWRLRQSRLSTRARCEARVWMWKATHVSTF